ncbi:MAG: tetratricopeptide repeat protein [Rhizobiaceae bacterium]|nr:tetratricopeptide repeat protein [Rhizobiaceae bacterium]
MIDQDRYGCDVTIANREALAAWNKTLHGFLSHAASTGPSLGETIEHDPNFALAHACKGLFSLLLGRRELDETIHSALKSAKASDQENPVTERERHYISALDAWVNGKQSVAINEMELVLQKWPHDPLAMKMSHAIRFMLGDLKGMRTSLENIMHVYGGHAAEGYFHGCYAFTLEETGDYGLAEKRGRKALELAADDSWGLHAVSHVFDMTGRAKEGLEWITGKEAAWEHCNNFRYHVWWHIALMHLELGNYDKVLELYDEQIRKDKTDDYRDISNATSVLLRLEFEGVKVGNRWEELAELSANRVSDNCVAFADLHYMMALCGTNDFKDQSSNLISNMNGCAETRHHCEFVNAIKHPGVLAATGLEAYRDHDFATAYDCLSKAWPTLQEIGGSHAQRDIFERLGIEAALRAGLTSETETLLRQRDLERGHQDQYSMSRWALVEQNTNSALASLGAA